MDALKYPAILRNLNETKLAMFSATEIICRDICRTPITVYVSIPWNLKIHHTKSNSVSLKVVNQQNT